MLTVKNKIMTVTVKFSRHEVLNALKSAYPDLIPEEANPERLEGFVTGMPHYANDEVIAVYWPESRGEPIKSPEKPGPMLPSGE